MYDEVIPKLRAKLGDDHPTVLTAKHGLAKAYEKLGELAEAVRLYQSTMAQRRARLGADHPDTLLTMFALASAYMADNRPTEAIPLAREFLERAETLRGRLPSRVTTLIDATRRLLTELHARGGQAQSSSPPQTAPK
jgi:hypothetical protein